MVRENPARGLTGQISPATFNLQLLTAYATSADGILAVGDVLKSWTFLRAWPTKWDISGFDSSESKVVVDSLELSYTSVLRMSPVSIANLALSNPDTLVQAVSAVKSTLPSL